VRYVVIREFQDRGIAWLLRSRKHVMALLRIVAPRLALVVDPRSLREEPTNLLSETLARNTEDVIWRGALRSGVPFRALVAHQSSPDRWLAKRVHQALVQLEAHDVRERAKRLVPCVPIVVHTGRRPWTPPSLRALYGSHEALDPFRHELPLALIDLAATRSARALSATGEPLGWLLALWSAQFASRATFLRALRITLDGLHGCARGARFLEAAWFCYQLAMNRRPQEEHAMLRRAIEEHLPARESGAMSKTIAEHVQERYAAIASGAKAGPARQQDTVLAVLVVRFGRVPRTVLYDIRRVTAPATLKKLVDRAATVKRLADFKVPRAAAKRRSR
jgi:hypothetical protein